MFIDRPKRPHRNDNRKAQITHVERQKLGVWLPDTRKGSKKGVCGLNSKPCYGTLDGETFVLSFGKKSTLSSFQT